MLELENISLKRGRAQILSEISVKTIKSGLIILLGTNGSGKTSLLNCISGILQSDSGSFIYKNKAVDVKSEEWKKQISYVQDDGGTIPLLTVEEQLNLQCLLIGLDKNEAAGRTEEMIKLFGLNEHRNHRADELSAGLRKKLGLGIGFIREADIYLFDEPFSSLDIQSGKILIRLLSHLRNRRKIIILSTHAPSFLSGLCDCVWQLSEKKITEHCGREDLSQFLDEPETSPESNEVSEISWIEKRI